MRVAAFSTIGVIWLVVCLHGDARAQSDEGTRVQFPSGDRQIAGVLFEPPGPGPFPALVQVPGGQGNRRGDLSWSKRLAAAGYVTLMVDLAGRVPTDFGEGLRLRDQVIPRAATDLRAAVAYLRTLPKVSRDRVGGLGMSTGGGFIVRLAIAEPTLAVGVTVYGHVYDTEVVDEESLKKIRACVLAIDGEESRVTSMPAVKMFANVLREAGRHVELHILPEAAYNFMDPEHANYQAAAAEDAWKKTLAFLRAHLADRTSEHERRGLVEMPSRGRVAVRARR